MRILSSFKFSSFQDLGRFLLYYFITCNINVQIIGKNNLLKAILKVTSSGDKFALVRLIFHTSTSRTFSEQELHHYASDEFQTLTG